MRIRKKHIIEIADMFYINLSNSKLYDIVALLDIGEDYYFSDYTTSSEDCLFTIYRNGAIRSTSIYNKLKQLLCNLSEIDNPEILEKFIKLLDLLLNKYSGCNDCEKLNKILSIYNIQIVENGRYKVILKGPKTPEMDEDKIDTLWPQELKDKFDRILERYSSADFRAFVAELRNFISEALPKAIHRMCPSIQIRGGNKYKNMIKDMNDKRLLRDTERDGLNKFYDYLSSFSPTHGDVISDRSRAEYMISITIFISNLLIEIAKNNCEEEGT